MTWFGLSGLSLQTLHKFGETITYTLHLNSNFRRFGHDHACVYNKISAHYISQARRVARHKLVDRVCYTRRLGDGGVRMCRDQYAPRLSMLYTKETLCV